MSSSRSTFRSGPILSAMMLTLILATTQQAEARQVSHAAANMIGQQLTGAFTPDSPFTPSAPEHLWFDVGDGSFLFLHLNAPFSDASGLMFTGWAVEGRWCAEDQPSPEFTHFHRTARVGAWGAGHGGSTPGEQGYWLKHVAVQKMEMPAMMGMPARTIEPGADGMFMPTRAPCCG